MSTDRKYWHYLILLLLALIWGSSFILMKRGMEAYSHKQVAALRIFIACISLLPFAWSHLKLMLGKNSTALLISGLCGNFIPAFLYTKAETQLPSSIVGTLSSLIPLFTLLLGVFVFNVKVKWLNILGVFIGFTGAIGLVLAEGNINVSGNMYFAFYVALATLMYAISVNVTKTYLQELNAILITALSMLFVGPIAGIYLFSTDFVSVLSSHPQAYSGLIYVGILAVVGTAFSVIVFNYLIKITSAVFASMVTYVIPVFALMWGFLDGEKIQTDHFIWIAVIFTGIFLVSKKTASVSISKTKKIS